MNAAVPERFLALEGCANFRDLGGLATRDGRRVRSRLIYRSAALTNLSAADRELLAGLGIRLLFDLRTTTERKLKPIEYTHAAGEGPNFWGGTDDHSRADLDALIGGESATADAYRSFMIGTYRDTIYRKAESYRALLLAIAGGETPLVMFCVWGKDRTGLGAAILLDLLGVPRDQIEADYILSTEPSLNGFYRMMEMPRSRFHRLRDVPTETWLPLASADPDYLAAAFAQIEADHGSVEAYARDVLELTPADIARVRERMLENSD